MNKNIFYLRSNAVNPDPRVEKEVHALLEAGHKVTIIGWNRNQEVLDDKLKIDRFLVEVVRCEISSGFGLGIKGILKLFLFQIFLLRTLWQKRSFYDVIHAADFDTVIPAYLMKIIYRKKLVYDIYDYYAEAFSVPKSIVPVIKKIDNSIISRSDAVIITNESRVKQINDATPRKLVIIHNSPADTNVVNSVRQRQQFTISYVGILQEHRFIKEMLQIVALNPHFNLQIAGFGKLEGLCKEYGDKFQNITFHGKVSYKDSLDIAGKSDVLFAIYDPKIPNHKYSSPNKLYEAMMLAKPLIVCRDTGLDVVESEEIGVVSEYSIDSVLGAIGFLYSNHDKCVIMGENGRRCYEEQYSWGIMKNRLCKLYAEL